MLEDLKKLLFDFAKIVFAGVVVDSVMSKELRPNVVLISGIATIVIMVAIAFLISWLINHLKNK